MHMLRCSQTSGAADLVEIPVDIAQFVLLHRRDGAGHEIVRAHAAGRVFDDRLYRHFHGRVRMSFGWGTNLTNDFRGCDPDGGTGLDPISLVCKVTSANGRPAVKLSDNPLKATGDPAEIERYRRVFGVSGQDARPVDV